ncbi:MAG TPA: exodeoxyribonuclease III [Opitutales bacterium]|jgi:exodeoxyribonuclease-3|nr:exodeoxyribonuclease III [Opitutales bacterium]
MPTLISWNVNGLRSVIGKGLLTFIEQRIPDVLCLQEIKISEEHVPALALPYAHQFWHHAEKPGYSGTAILSHVKPRQVLRDFPGKHVHPAEGRVLAAEFAGYWLVNVYVPNSRRELVRLPYRQKEWDPALRKFLSDLAREKPVIVCGDFNVAHAEIDLANPASNRRNAGFTDEERTGFTDLLGAGFVDVFRDKHPGEKGHYSWWTYRSDARARNIGWRIDYFLVSSPLAKKVREAFIWPDVTGSDHCPVGIELAAKL